MKHTAKKFLAVLLCVALLAMMPIAVSVSAEVSAERQALLDAWANLKYEESTQIGYLNMGGSLSDNKVADIRDTVLADLSDEEVALMGTYFETSANSGTDLYGNVDVADLSGFEKISWAIYSAETTNASNVCIGLNNYTNWLRSYFTVTPGFHNYEFTVESGGQAAKLLNGEATATKPYAKVPATSDALYLGIPLAWKTVSAALPENADTMTDKELYEAAVAALEAKTYVDGVEEFEVAIKDMYLVANPEAAALIEAWGGLKYEVGTEIGFLAGGTYSSQQKVASIRDTVLANLTDEQVAAMGTYYALKETKGDIGGGVTHSGMTDLTGYEKITWAVYNGGATGASVNLSVNSYNNWLCTWWGVGAGGYQNWTFDATNANAALLFKGEISAAKPYAKVESNNAAWTGAVYFGSPIAWKSVAETIPAEVYGLSLKDLLETASALDLSKYVDGVEEFQTAIDDLFAVVYPEAEALIDAWGKLTYEVLEEVIPMGSYNTSEFVQNTGVTLSADQLAQLGSKYAKVGTAEGCADASKDLAVPKYYPDYKKLTVSVYGVSKGSFTLKWTGNSWDWKNAQWPYLNSGEFKTLEIDDWWPGLIDGSTTVRCIQYQQNGVAGPYYVGSVMGVKEAFAQVPADIATMSLEEMLAAAKAVDTSVYTAGVEAFEKAIADLNTAIYGEANAALVEALEGVSAEIVETVAVPNSADKKEVSGTIDGLDDPSKLGTYWVEKAPKAEIFWTVLDGIDTSVYSSLTVTARGFNSDGNGVDTKFALQVNYANTQYKNSHTTGWFTSPFATGIKTTENLKVSPMTGDKAGGVAPAYISYGSVIGKRTIFPTVPEGYETMTTDELLAAINEMDLSAYTNGVAALESAVKEAEDANANVAVSDDALVVDDTYAYAGDEVTVTVAPAEGYVLKAGSLVAYDANGKAVAVPQRVGFQTEDAQSAEYTFAATGKDIVVKGEFVKETDLTVPNMGSLGWQMRAADEETDTKAAIRNIQRLHVYEKDGAFYTKVAGVETKVASFGMIIGTEGSTVADATKGLAVEDAVNNNAFIYDFSQMARRFDVCSDYQDLSVAVTNMDKRPNLKVVSRAYILLEGAEEYIYTDVIARSYNDMIA